MLETTIIGNIGSMRLAAAGETQVLNVSIAASRKLGDREFTDWVSAKIWGGRATKLQPHLHKGGKVMLRGRPEVKGFQRHDGTVTAELILHVADVEFLSAKPKDDSDPQLPLEAQSKQPRKKPKN